MAEGRQQPSFRLLARKPKGSPSARPWPIRPKRLRPTERSSLPARFCRFQPLNHERRGSRGRRGFRLEQAKESGQLRGFGVDVKSHNGILELSGRASSPAQRDAIIGIAESVPGVAGVREAIAIPTAAPNLPRLPEPPSLQDIGGNSLTPSLSIRLATRYAVEPRPPWLPARLPCPRWRPLPNATGRLRRDTCQHRGHGLGCSRCRTTCPNGSLLGRWCTAIRYAEPTELRLARLRGLPQLRRGYLSATVQPHGLALHWPVLPLSSSSIGMATCQPGMG